MADHSDVVDRADSLMRRRRSFVASYAGKAENASASPPVNEDEDLPVLTDVVSAETVVPETRPDRYDEEALLTILATGLVRTLERQLAEELPTLVEAALLSAQHELHSGINATLEMALKAFLARRHQLSLPLDEPHPGN